MFLRGVIFWFFFTSFSSDILHVSASVFFSRWSTVNRDRGTRDLTIWCVIWCVTTFQSDSVLLTCRPLFLLHGARGVTKKATRRIRRKKLCVRHIFPRPPRRQHIGAGRAATDRACAAVHRERRRGYVSALAREEGEHRTGRRVLHLRATS